MTRSDAEIERLNAYVDGELDAAEAAEVAALIASDRDAARLVAMMARVKSGVRDAFPSSLETGDVLPGRRPWPARALAAACLLLTVAATSWILLRPPAPPGDIIAMALQYHDGWHNAVADRPEAASVTPDFTVPDLTAAGLTVSTVQTGVALGAVTAAHVTYEGSRGCRLSLYAYPAQPGVPEISADLGAETLIERWNAGALDYLLIARLMDGRRFGVIAAALREATSRALPMDDRTRTAMSRTRRPCRT